MNQETIDNVLEDMFHYAELAVTGDNEKKIIKEFADRVKWAWDREKASESCVGNVVTQRI